MADEKLKAVMKMGVAYTAKMIADALNISEDEAREMLDLAVTRGWVRAGYGRHARVDEKMYLRRR